MSGAMERVEAALEKFESHLQSCAVLVHTGRMDGIHAKALDDAEAELRASISLLVAETREAQAVKCDERAALCDEVAECDAAEAQVMGYEPERPEHGEKAKACAFVLRDAAAAIRKQGAMEKGEGAKS